VETDPGESQRKVFPDRYHIEEPKAGEAMDELAVG
jgi:hypothetical protein